MKRKLNILAGDTALWVIFFLISGISLIAVYSSIGLSAISEMLSSPSAVFFRHLVIVLATYVAIIILSHINYRYFSKVSKWLFYISIGLLILVLFIGTKRWIRLPGGLSFQPSEIAKIALMVYLARTIVRNRETLDVKQTFFMLLLPVAVICLLIVPENLSTALIIFMACYITLFFGGVNKQLWWKGMAIILAVAVVGFIMLYLVGDKMDFARSSTWGHRLQAWMHPNPAELTQENMARMAVARGGFWGSGIGTTIHGRLMTQAHNDFIYAIIIEEAGLLSAIGIFLLYALFYFRCIRIATRCQGTFGSLSVAGIGTVIFLQALVHMSVSVGLLPVTGQTLPFISYGGTAYLFLGLGIGVIQSVAADNKKQARLAQKAEAESLKPGVRADIHNDNEPLNENPIEQ